MKLHAETRTPERAVIRIPLDAVSPSPYQPRQTFQESTVAALAESIRQHGLLTPLLVRRIAAGKYELIAGERRLRALKLLERTHADAIVLTAFDRSCAMLSLIENLQREDLHYLDEAESFRTILENHPVTQDSLARALSLSPSALANRLRLLKLSDAVRLALRESNLTERHARALLQLNDEKAQLALISEAEARKMSVKQLEARIHRMTGIQHPTRNVSRIVRDNRIVINAVLDTVRELNRIGVQANSRIEEHADSIDVIVTIRPPVQIEKDDASP